MLPLLVAGASLASVYSAGKALDSNRYWNDYYRNTGHKPKYPWRAGVYDWVGDLGYNMMYGYGVGRTVGRSVRRYYNSRYYR